MAALLDIDAELPLDALDRFAAMLDDRDAEIRTSAVWGLGFLGGDDPAIVPHLIAALGDGAPDVRERAAWSLGMNGEAAGISVPLLVEVLDDPEARVRAAAVQAIGQMGEAAVPAAGMLMESLEDSDPEVQREAYEALTTIAALSEEELPDVVAALDAHPLNVDAREHGRVSISKNYKN